MVKCGSRRNDTAKPSKLAWSEGRQRCTIAAFAAFVCKLCFYWKSDCLLGMSSQVREGPRALGTYLTHFGESGIKRPLRVREVQKKKYRVGHVEIRSISLLAPFGNKAIIKHILRRFVTQIWLCLSKKEKDG